MAKFTHSVMPHSLAKALIEAGVHHFDAGGTVIQDTPQNLGAINSPSTQGSLASTPSFIGGLSTNPIATVGSSAKNIASDFTAQNGFVAGLAPTQTSDYGGTIGAASGNALAGYGQAQGIQAQQQQLANALLAQSQGQGPNPAQAALATNTGNNAAMQAALMASQRGSGANAGLIARGAAQQGGAIQQAAVGQAATLQAQQQLAAQQELQAQQQALASGNIAEQGINAGIFGTAAGAQNAQNAGSIQNTLGSEKINADTAGANAAAVNKTEGSFLNSAGGLLSMLSKGGMAGSHLHKMAAIYHPHLMTGAHDFKAGGKVPGKAPVKGDSVKNDKIPALLSAGEEVLPRSVTQSPDAPQKAKEFVQHLMEQQKGKGGAGYEKVAASKKSLKSRIERLEKLYQGGVAA